MSYSEIVDSASDICILFFFLMVKDHKQVFVGEKRVGGNRDEKREKQANSAFKNYWEEVMDGAGSLKS